MSLHAVFSSRAPRASTRSRPAHTRAGFTLIEVMVAAAVFTIGIVGVTYMQSASIRSNQDAYESMVATNFAKQWLERIKRDALNWTTIGVPLPAAMFPTRTTLERSTYFVPEAVPVNDSGLWPLDASESTGINYHGFEIGETDPITGLAVGNADTYYCATGRFFTASTNSGGLLTAMTARVAVWWNRKASLEATQYPEITTARQGGCDAVRLGFDIFAEPIPERVRRVRLATAVRWAVPL